ncbi:nuclear factor 7, brain-like [Rhinoderma darwinii]|uniref:nuclear factor 7, brain-like n=1 Tax=Rhinoderma darwinii TaxID=43563 RepID=UPI003F661EEA
MSYLFLMKEITCSLCSTIYTDPVMLSCGHNFCSHCIESHISTEGGSGIYRCPECKQAAKTKAPLNVNTKLQSIAQNWKSVENHHCLGEASCAYCLEDLSPAVKICLHCECLLCKKNLQVHSKSMEHALADVTRPLQNRICSVHGEILKFYCTTDKALICMLCFVTGDHRGHLVELLETASRNRREELEEIAGHMQAEIDRLKKRGNDLKGAMRGNKVKAKEVKDEVGTLCRGLLVFLREVETKMETYIERQEEEAFREIVEEIASLEKKNDMLSQRIKQVEDLCDQNDPLLVLQDKTRHHPRNKRQKTEQRAFQSVDLLLVSLQFKKTIENFEKFVSTLWSTHCLHLKYKADVLLNIAMASNYLRVSSNRKAVRCTATKGKRKQPSPGRIKCSHVLSESAFSSGRHYWEVKSDGSGVKRVGVAYPSMEKDTSIGYNQKSWCLTWGHGNVVVCHNSKRRQIESGGSTMTAVAVYLDYEAGRISFYKICSSVAHLYTFTTRFTEPIHAAFYLVGGWIKINP